ncbi:hypothetical protein [Pseudomonas alkylphenolica]|uniref:hypothetical protein n=1 Tax=Pseudomonas alkylphenolica TaxID=237609 RepID=UPI0018D8E086|nr:hypothetical protein [Pseudomonas alkylphenolica]MBH3426175.1 hypothetical protein [Pseudomonas alkylphenolica]
MSKRDDIPQTYYEGRECRQRGSNKLANPFSAISIKAPGGLQASTTWTWNSPMKLKRMALQRHQRRAQVHLPPSGFKGVPNGDDVNTARRASPRESSQVAGGRPALEGSTRY